MAKPTKLSILFAILPFLLVCRFSCSEGFNSDDPYLKKSLGDRSGRSVLSNQRNSNNQISNCAKFVSKSQCSQNPKCQWCQSDTIDDMCFTRSEAWRLPQQVFTCDGIGFF